MQALKKAYKLSQEDGEGDPELDLEGLEEPKWGHQTFRRTADKLARRHQKDTGAKKEDIDELFGWKQAERAKDMQRHYAGLQERAFRACELCYDDEDDLSALGGLCGV